MERQTRNCRALGKSHGRGDHTESVSPLWCVQDILTVEEVEKLPSLRAFQSLSADSGDTDTVDV